MSYIKAMAESTGNPIVDLRSDTVTRPTAAMRAAMAAAEVGDDVYGEDPTVNRLEARAAEVFGREAALFVPTGSMGNQIAIHLHTQPGQEVVCEARAHVLDWEMGMAAVFFRVHADAACDGGAGDVELGAGAGGDLQGRILLSCVRPD